SYVPLRPRSHPTTWEIAAYPLHGRYRPMECAARTDATCRDLSWPRTAQGRRLLWPEMTSVWPLGHGDRLLESTYARTAPRSAACIPEWPTAGHRWPAADVCGRQRRAIASGLPHRDRSAEGRTICNLVRSSTRR